MSLHPVLCLSPPLALPPMDLVNTWTQADLRAKRGVGRHPLGWVPAGLQQARDWVCQLHVAPFDALIWPHLTPVREKVRPCRQGSDQASEPMRRRAAPGRGLGSTATTRRVQSTWRTTQLRPPRTRTRASSGWDEVIRVRSGTRPISSRPCLTVNRGGDVKTESSSMKRRRPSLRSDSVPMARRPVPCAFYDFSYRDLLVSHLAPRGIAKCWDQGRNSRPVPNLPVIGQKWRNPLPPLRNSMPGAQVDGLRPTGAWVWTAIDTSGRDGFATLWKMARVPDPGSKCPLTRGFRVFYHPHEGRGRMSKTWEKTCCRASIIVPNLDFLPLERAVWPLAAGRGAAWARPASGPASARSGGGGGWRPMPLRRDAFAVGTHERQRVDHEGQ